MLEHMYAPLLLETVYRYLIRFKARTLLIGLCIAVSVFATVLLPAVADSLLQAVGKFSSRTNPADAVFLFGNIGTSAGRPRNNFKLADVEAVRQTIGGIKDVDILVRVGARTVKNGDRSTSVLVTGTSERAPFVQRTAMAQGGYFDELAVRTRRHVAVIGTTTAAKLFGPTSPVGAEIFIDNIPFRIVGELESQGVGPHGNDLDDALEVPYTTLMDQVLHVDYLTGAKFVAKDPESVAEVADKIADLMRQRHHIDEGQGDDFGIVTPSSIQERIEQGRKIFSVFIVLTSGAAFLISAFIVANIVAVAIRERTSEIGIRKAVGATSSAIVLQIVLEVAVVGLAAALVGICLAEVSCAVLAPILKAKTGAMSVEPTALQILAGVALALATAVAAAFIPSKRAAGLGAIVALRS